MATTLTGPSSSQTPYVLPVDSATGVKVTSILTTGDATRNGYKMAGIPDGLGAFDNLDGTFTLLMNHELGSTTGVARAHGGKGAFVSSWVINKADLSVVSGGDLIQKVYNWDVATQRSAATVSTLNFNRFCSADLPEVSAFYNPLTGLGTQERIFMNGEEGGSTGYAVATVVTGASKGNAYILGKFNPATNGSGGTSVGGWENLLANPLAQDKTVVIGNNDGGTGVVNNALVVYVGTKQNTGSEIDKAGLTNGTIKYINVAGNAAEIVNTTTRATNITSGTRFSLSATAPTTFSRPEDGSWNPLNPNEYFFVTTDQLDTVSDGLGTQVGRSRLWRLTFDDIKNPDGGGRIDLLLDGTEGGNMFDNLTLDKAGHVLLQEDTGNAAHNAKMWQYDIATDKLTLLTKFDPARFGDTNLAATAPFTVDEETSGIIDMQDILGSGWFLFDAQAHYTTGIAPELVEGGQLLALYSAGLDQRLATTLTGPSSSQTPYVLPVDSATGVKVTSILTTGDATRNGYKMAGIPDGLGAFDNLDGTFTLLMNHELGSTTGVARAHGGKGAFVSSWVINKSDLSVVSGGDLIQKVYNWDVATQRSAATVSTLNFNRFCSADLPEVSAFYNPLTGLGTQERIFMNGEEGGSTGYAVATVVTGASKGNAYILGKFNPATNGTGGTSVGMGKPVG
ncbi:MAG: hypothetical protein LVS60_19245 [Nodosilinea sp. LVE1205-7]